MPYWQLFYHIAWSTKNREPLLTPDLEPLVYELIHSKAIGLGATVFAVNGMADHVHLITSIPPKIAVATFIGQVKGITSTKVNKSLSDFPSFAWQEEYGIFSFDKKRLPNHITYVDRQKAHHSQGTIIPLLERIDENKRTSIARR